MGTILSGKKYALKLFNFLTKIVKPVRLTSCCYNVLTGFVSAYNLRTHFLAGISFERGFLSNSKMLL